jgi:hypothetical protein
MCALYTSENWQKIMGDRFFLPHRCCNAYLAIVAAVKGQVTGVKPFSEICLRSGAAEAEQAMETESNAPSSR